MKELKALIGLLIFSGAMKDNHLPTQMMFDDLFCGCRYRATMSRERFNFLINCLRFDDKKTREERKKESKLAPVKEIWDKVIQNCRDNYKPGSYCTIDEQLVGFRGRCPFRVYMSSKPNRYGIKIIMLCDSGTNYMVDAIVQLGKGSIVNIVRNFFRISINHFSFFVFCFCCLTIYLSCVCVCVRRNRYTDEYNYNNHTDK